MPQIASAATLLAQTRVGFLPWRRFLIQAKIAKSRITERAFEITIPKPYRGGLDSRSALRRAMASMTRRLNTS